MPLPSPLCLVIRRRYPWQVLYMAFLMGRWITIIVEVESICLQAYGTVVGLWSLQPPYLAQLPHF